jgi:hypothetical protein
MKFTLKKIIIFFSIIGLGIVGLMVADQYNFLNGRKEVVTTIGNGTPDPLVSGTASSTIQQNNPAGSVKKQTTPIDGIKKAN